MLRHAVPRLDAVDKLWLLPAPLAYWLFGGLASGVIAAFIASVVLNVPLDEAFNVPAVWLVWALAIVVSTVGAFVRPGGLDAAQWVMVLVAYRLVPRRAVWRPTGE